MATLPTRTPAPEIVLWRLCAADYKTTGVDRRMCGALTALAAVTGLQHAWVRDFVEIYNTVDGKIQIRELWGTVLEALQQSSYGECMPIPIFELCQLPVENLGDVGDAVLSEHGTPYNWGDVLIFETIMQAWRKLNGGDGSSRKPQTVIAAEITMIVVCEFRRRCAVLVG